MDGPPGSVSRQSKPSGQSSSVPQATVQISTKLNSVSAVEVQYAQSAVQGDRKSPGR